MFDVTCLDKYGNTITSLYQWDSNQVLYIEDHGFTTPPAFHFCNQNSEKALLVQSEINDGVMTVSIPNALLIEPYKITAYVYLSEDKSGKTVEVITLPVRSRPMPENFEYVDDPKIVNIVELAAEMRGLMSNFSNAEDARVKAEAIRVSNENTRIEKEKARANAESTREQNETQRSQSESARVASETARSTAEATRQSNEVERSQSESERVASEGARESAEYLRSTSESERVESESVRESNEAVRVSNENARQSAESERSASESARIASESERCSAEIARSESESSRADAELIRESQEAARQTSTSTALSEVADATKSANSAAALCESVVDKSGIVLKTDLGVAGGVATLDEDALVSIEQLPYVVMTTADIDAILSE